MTYTLDESHTSRNYTPAAQVPAVFGYPRTVDYITIHHWGANGQQFGTVRDYLCTNTTPTSAHFIVQDGEVACIVSPLDAAWHAGNARGNAQSIGIECHPEATDGDYQTIGELVAWLRAQYGDVPLVPHNYWTQTACPGDYDLNRIDAIARGTTGPVSAASSTITPIPQEATLSAAEVDAIVAEANKQHEVTRQLILNALGTVPGKVLTEPVQYHDPATGQPTGGTTSLATFAGFGDFQHQATRSQVPAAVWNLNIGPGNAAGVLAHIDAKPAAAAVDVLALAAALAPHLTAASADQLVAALRSLTFAAK
jgi:hypothetical protein